MSVIMEYMTLRELLETKGNVESLMKFRNLTGMSRQQAWALWNGKDTLGLRVAKRIADATGLSLDELAEVDEAVPASRRARKPPTDQPPDMPS
jgi:transcriptional regulator with XRE-family HTH domain